MLIHVSGTTGSGKTYLGNLMSEIYDPKKLLVVDLDMVFHTVMNSKDILKIEKIEDRIEAIRDAVRHDILELTGKYKNVLVVGYSDFLVNGRAYFVDLGADKRFFIDIPIDALLKQYKYRASIQVMSTRHEMRVMSTSDLKNTVKVDRKIYNRYTWLPQQKIIKELILLIGK